MNELFGRLSQDEDLKFLDGILFAMARSDQGEGQDVTSDEDGAPADRPQEFRRASISSATRSSSSMENVYVDLNLEAESDHPDNRGWMNIFHNWAWSPMLRVAWAMSAASYGARFQTFCERKLGLRVGRAVLDEPLKLEKGGCAKARRRNSTVEFRRTGHPRETTRQSRKTQTHS